MASGGALIALSDWNATHTAVATLSIPINVSHPHVSLSNLVGNSFWTVRGSSEGFSTWDSGHWEFVRDVDSKIYGSILIPNNITTLPNVAVSMILAVNSATTLPSNSVMSVATAVISAAGSITPAFTAETSQMISFTSARYRYNATFPSTGNLAKPVSANDLLLVEISHTGTSTSDNADSNTIMYSSYLRCDVNT